MRVSRWMLLCLICGCVMACSSPTPPPGWPSGEARPINAAPVAKAAK